VLSKLLILASGSLTLLTDLSACFTQRFSQDFTEEEIRDIVTKPFHEMRGPDAEKNQFLADLIGNAESIANLILNKPVWEIWQAPEGLEFITSDNPLVSAVMLRHGKFHPGYGFRKREIIALFPLAPAACLAAGEFVAGTKGVVGYRSVKASIVTEINEAMLSISDRYVYSKTLSEEVRQAVDLYGGTIRYGVNALMPVDVKMPSVAEASAALRRVCGLKQSQQINILPDTRDLIDLTEHSQPGASDAFREYLLSHNHQVVLTFNNVRELAGPLAVGDRDFLRIRPYLQSLEAMPHTYLKEVRIVGIELQSAVAAFTNGTEYQDVSPYVNRWDGTLMTQSGQVTSYFEMLVGLRLDEIVYEVFRYQPEAFAPLTEKLPDLVTLLEQDRELLRAGKAPIREHFKCSIKKHANYHKVALQVGKEEEFARWIYSDPRRCPGLRLNHEVYRRLMRNHTDVPEVGDFVDLNLIFAVPYVDAATLDNRMREYCSQAAGSLVRLGLVVDYRNRLYRNLVDVMQKNP
jgi:hypothetical protein